MFSSVLKALWSFFTTAWGWITDLVQSVLSWFGSFISNFFYTILDLFLTFFESIISSIPVPDAWVGISKNPLGSVPPLVIYLFNSLGIFHCISIIGAAYGIRFMLNLIPGAFTRV